MHGGNNSSYGDDPASYYPAIQIESGIEITLVNLFVDKRAAGLILESYNTSYSTYGYLTAPDAQIDVDGSSVSHTKSLDQGTNGGSACKRIQGLSLFISSDMKAITDVDCTIHVPVTGQEPDYSPVCTGSLYYLNAHNIGNILNDTSWQVWTGSSWDMNAVNPGDHFEGARSYRVLFDVTALDGYFFANGLVGTLNGAVPSDYWVGGFQTTYRFIQEFPKTKAGWCKIDNKWYYYDSDGSKHTGWLKLNGKYYYMDSNGVMQTGWKKVNGKYYYMNSSGVMLTGWQKIGGKWYYLETSGAMVIGWKKLENQWYYFSSSGAMVTGWQDINGKTYYFKSSGVMAAKEWCNGWWLNADGTWTYKYKASWKQNSNGWWFGDTSGWYAKNTTIMIDGKLYTFNAAGYWVQ